MVTLHFLWLVDFFFIEARGGNGTTPPLLLDGDTRGSRVGDVATMMRVVVNTILREEEGRSLQPRRVDVVLGALPSSRSFLSSFLFPSFERLVFAKVVVLSWIYFSVG